MMVVPIVVVVIAAIMVIEIAVRLMAVTDVDDDGASGDSVIGSNIRSGGNGAMWNVNGDDDGSSCIGGDGVHGVDIMLVVVVMLVLLEVSRWTSVNVFVW